MGNRKSLSFEAKLHEKIIFASTLVYLTFFGWYVFYYQEKSAFFPLTSEHFLDKIDVPGGALNYAASFITSLGHVNVLGALAASCTIWLAMVFCRTFLSEGSDDKRILIPLSAGALMFWLQTDYQYPFSHNLGLMLQLFLLNMATKKPGRWWPLILFPFWFWLTGGFSWIFFFAYALSLIISLKYWGLLRIALMAAWTASLIWFASDRILFLTTYTILTHPADLSISGVNRIALVILSGLIIILPVARLIRIRVPTAGILSLLTSVLIPLMIIAGISAMKYERDTSDFFRSESLFYEKKYEELIDFNLRNPSRNYITNYLVNIALCETGTLNDRLFSFNQSPEGRTLFMKWEIVGEILRKGGQFYYTMGMINEAHRWAFEYMVMHGPTPEGLKMLAKTEIINGNFLTAKRYVSMLKKSLFYRAEGKYLESLLFNEAAIEKDTELNEKRKIKLATDFFSITDDPVINVKRTVEVDSLNRKAFDYLMAWLLLSKDYKGIVEEWRSLDRYDYKRVPVHIHEAGVAISTLYNIKLPTLKNASAGNEVIINFNRYLQVFNARGADPARAEAALKEQFGTTFWYWVFYR
jgi:hypothetical protein